ncbi:hypothetical protein NI377_17715 [Vibrio parahaemolyticus]|nr:hypothetical protein NI377_17715 [Vibrio parahaemolyticus]
MFKKSTLAILIGATISLVGCGSNDKTEIRLPQAPTSEFTNVIDRTGNPTYLRDYDSYSNLNYNALTDNGAWHGHLLPEDAAGYGAFGGIMQVTQEYAHFMSGQTFDKLTLTDKVSGPNLRLIERGSESLFHSRGISAGVGLGRYSRANGAALRD